ncbi:MAG: 2'-deoxycytidine 5'-triphosphate deaminase [Solirubrobacterales bacterium]
MSEAPTGAAERGRVAAGGAPAVFPSQLIREAIGQGWITAGQREVPPESVQPASLDLRLGEVAWPLRCSFLPQTDGTVQDRVDDLAFDEIDLGNGPAVLERDRPYLIPLVERLNLPAGIRARTNPKSSTGRLDVFTRVVTDRSHRFDEIVDGYEGRLYLEVVPRSFAIRVEAGLALNQLRLVVGDPKLSDDEVEAVHREFPLVYMDSHPIPSGDLSLAGGLFLSVDLDARAAPGENIVGYRAKRNSDPIDLSSRGNTWRDYFEPVHAEAGNRIVLEPEVFYLLLSAEAVCIPPRYAAEMLPYDPTAGELRTHYAGFFDPGFGYAGESGRHGSRAALEVRARDVAFMVEHRQPICKLAFEHLRDEPDSLYGADVGSHYQGQDIMLSKHFKEQTAGARQMRLEGEEP